MSEPKLVPGPLVAATHNRGKIVELKELLEPLGFNVQSAIDLDLPEPDETEDTFAGNAILKAVAAATGANRVALSDDSGLAVHALNGEPGIYSARWAGEPRDFDRAMDRVQAELEAKGATDYSAHFVCALALAWPSGETKVFEGKVYGTLTFPKRGSRGFGYDPIFVADGETETFGEMDPAKKHAMSHRAEAFKLFETYLRG